MTIKTIFLDRDGVINKDLGYLYRIDDFEFIEGVFDGRGYYSEKDYHKLNDWMLAQFNKENIKILDTYYCPHSPESLCECRKPKPGMLLKAKNKYSINMKKSWIIGDRDTDIKAANLAGITNTILVRSGHNINANESSSRFITDSIKQSKELIGL